MVILGVFKADFRVTSKATALEFYKGVNSVILMPLDKNNRLRVEPDQHISTVSAESTRAGNAPFIPLLRDEDGSLAFQYRKYINAYLAAL